MTENVDVLILGAGPTGLGAAIRLQQLKHEDWLLIDGFSEAGGLGNIFCIQVIFI